MNVARVALLGVAVLAAGGAAFLVRSMTHKQEPKSRPVAIETPTAQVLVASHAIEPGTILSAADLRWQKWPQDAVSESYLTQKGTPNATDEATGAIVRAHVDPGEPLTRGKFVKAKNASFMAAMLSPGMRAVSVKISEESAAGGFILPGDAVDVVAVHKVDETDGQSIYGSQVVLSDVRVLAIGQTAEQTANDKTILGKTATLELADAQVSQVMAAQAGGELTLVLRSAATASGVTAATHPAPSGSNAMIHLVRYGHASRATPALAQGGAP